MKTHLFPGGVFLSCLQNTNIYVQEGTQQGRTGALHPFEKYIQFFHNPDKYISISTLYFFQKKLTMQIRGLDRTVTSQVNNWPFGWGKSQPWEQLDEKVIKLLRKQLFGCKLLSANNYLVIQAERERKMTQEVDCSQFLFYFLPQDSQSQAGSAIFPTHLLLGVSFKTGNSVLAGSASLKRKCFSGPKSLVPVC